ncbi:MAG: C cytochrome precursor [Myxococcota bacterium]|nr:C cytochrome precursor [Myxococcota bacterium]
MDSESIVVGLVAGLAILPSLRWVRHRIARFLVLILVLCAASFATASWRAASPAPLREHEVQTRPIRVLSDGYVGVDSCVACHPSQHASWQASYHRTMTQVASEATVLAPFDGRVLKDQGRRVRVFRLGKSYWAEFDDPEGRGSRVQRMIVVTTGSHSEQFYWYAAGKGRKLGLLGFVWRIAEQRWMPYLDVTVSPNAGHGPLSPPEGTWNRGCMFCHTTRPKMRLDPREHTFDTQVTNFGIACEACHGPGGEHVAANRSPIRRYRLRWSDEPDPTIVNPAHLSPRRASQVCGQCHGILPFLLPGENAAALSRDGLAYRPGEELEDTRHLVRPSVQPRPDWLQTLVERDPSYLRNRFWSDGMVRVSGREYNGLVDSPCFQGGDSDAELSCLSCHQMHQQDDDPRPVEAWADDQLASGARSDESCLGCHSGLRDRVAEHSHHAADSAGARCMNCHMPFTTFGLLKGIRSHRIESPSVQVSLDTGRPNGCNLCHLDQTLAWTAEALDDWYGIDPPRLGSRERTLPASWIWALSGDAGQRALLASIFGWEPASEVSNPAWHGAILARLLDDPYHAVRVVAHRSMAKLPEFADFGYDSRAPELDRKAAVSRALAIWNDARGAQGREHLARLSTSGEGEGLRAEKALLALQADRDDVPIVLQE